ncbi:MAG: hypothetical protein H6R27_572 [Proteobacteria bacterium]|nr:hypothetical protein [Pseudomonadota bacterium]
MTEDRQDQQEDQSDDQRCTALVSSLSACGDAVHRRVFRSMMVLEMSNLRKLPPGA